VGVYTFKTFWDKNIRIIIKVCFIVIRFYKGFNCMPAVIEPFKVSTFKKSIYGFIALIRLHTGHAESWKRFKAMPGPFVC